MNFEISLPRETWEALCAVAKHGVFAHDLLGPDDPQFSINEATVQRAHDAMQTINEHGVDVVLGRRHTPPVAIEAPAFPLAQAHGEGWTLDMDEERGEYVVRRLEDNGHFRNDDAADLFVRGKVQDGNYYDAAIAWLDRANILHRASVVRSKVKFQDAAE